MSDPRLSSCAIVFVTPDIEKTARYYRDILGFRIVEHYHQQEKFAALYRDAVEVVLVQSQYGIVKPNRESYGAGYDAYLVPESVEAVDAFYLEIKAKGAKITQRIRKPISHIRDVSNSQDQISTSPAVSVELLADNPHLVPAIGKIRWREWGHPPEPDSLDWWVDVTSREAGRDDLPVTWVAIDDVGQAVGAVGLGEFDIEERRDRSPWVIGMIVASRCRGMGIGGQLMATLESWAHHRGYSRAWVATGGRAVDFYRKCGWELTEIVDRASGEMASILTKSL